MLIPVVPKNQRTPSLIVPRPAPFFQSMAFKISLISESRLRGLVAGRAKLNDRQA